ncbi:MAG: DUF4430 domain-containing protein [Lachnospiraceae bacterium]|nr:DUF4430 domain-containing protein [Lachnospiraceae bacterium]
MKKLEDLWKKISWQLLHRKAVRYIAIALVILALGGVGLSKVNIEPANQGAKVKDQVEILGGEKTKEAGRTKTGNSSKKDAPMVGGTKGDTSKEDSSKEDSSKTGSTGDSSDKVSGENSKNKKDSSTKNQVANSNSKIDEGMSQSSGSESGNNQNTNTQSDASKASEATAPVQIKVSIEISCSRVAGANASRIQDESKRSHVESLNNGEILSANVTMMPNQSVYDALVKATQAAGVELGARNSNFGTYVYEIDNLREKDAGPNSGWMYSVNGAVPQKSAAAYYPKEGDTIQWFYVV